ncbi:MAG: hypothetical protein IKU22_04750 [Alistipes sp.]|nr:hypothetical protein [Alistipes sp.]
MAGNLYQRYVWLLDTVKSYNGITFEQIDKAWQRSHLNDDGTPLPKRTLRNHIDAIDEMFNMRIVCNRQGGYKYYIEGSDGGKLSETQKALLGHLQLSNILLDNKVNNYIELAHCSIYDTIQTLAEAINIKRMVTFSWTHHTYGAQRVEISPYYLKQFANIGLSWCLLGALPSGEDVIYELKNISNLTISDKEFIHPEISLAEYCDSIDMGNRPLKDTDDSFGLFIDHASENGQMDEWKKG